MSWMKASSYTRGRGGREGGREGVGLWYMRLMKVSFNR